MGDRSGVGSSRGKSDVNGPCTTFQNPIESYIMHDRSVRGDGLLYRVDMLYIYNDKAI